MLCGTCSESLAVSDEPSSQVCSGVQMNGLEPATDEEQQRAAVKIQAGIRGYRDRQRVKAMRYDELDKTGGVNSGLVSMTCERVHHYTVIVVRQDHSALTTSNYTHCCHMGTAIKHPVPARPG